MNETQRKPRAAKGNTNQLGGEENAEMHVRKPQAMSKGVVFKEFQ